MHPPRACPECSGSFSCKGDESVCFACIYVNMEKGTEKTMPGLRSRNGEKGRKGWIKQELKSFP